MGEAAINEIFPPEKYGTNKSKGKTKKKKIAKPKVFKEKKPEEIKKEQEANKLIRALSKQKAKRNEGDEVDKY
jgi:hypothetical protein